MVRKADWGHGKNCTLFAFDNVANGCFNSLFPNPKQSGELRLVFDFGTNPGVNITVILFGEFENLLEIDRNKAVLYVIYQRGDMERVSLNNGQLDHLARSHPSLGPHFYGTVPCDRLPYKPDKCGPLGYIVNTEPQGQPGRHWIALWTQNNVCELMDSYEMYLST